MKKKAEIGIGTLIIFIAMILVAAIAAGVLLQTASSLQNKALLTGERSKVQVSTGISTIVLYAEDGRDQDLEVLCQKMKLQPGSEPMKLSDTLIEVQTKNASESLIYGIEIDKNVTTTQQQIPIDFDGDGTNDYVRIDTDGNSTDPANDNILFVLSNGTTYNISLGVDLMNAGTTPVELSIFNTPINDSNHPDQIGAFAILGTTETDDQIDKSVYFFVAKTDGGASGAYDVNVLVQGSLYRPGYINRGDMVKICYPAPRELHEDENIRINVVPKTGAVHTIETSIPDVVTHQRVYIFP